MKQLHAGRDRKYFQVILCKNKKKKQLFVHRLVYEAFAGKIPDGLTIDHIDCNSNNNTIENLQVLTREENSRKGGLKRLKSRENDQTIFYNLPPKLVKFLSAVIHRDYPKMKIKKGVVA